MIFSANVTDHLCWDQSCHKTGISKFDIIPWKYQYLIPCPDGEDLIWNLEQVWFLERINITRLMQKSYVTSGGGEARQALQWCMSTLWKLSLETLLNIQDRHVSVYQYFYNTSWNTKGRWHFWSCRRMGSVFWRHLLPSAAMCRGLGVSNSCCSVEIKMEDLNVHCSPLGWCWS